MNWSIPLLLFFSSLVLVASNGNRPLIIAHRGSPCRFPEETVHGYEYAINLGVDYIELDVISTKDEVLIARHDLTLDASTNVEDREKFSNKTTKEISGGIKQTGYFAIDLTFDRIKGLRAEQVFPFRDRKVHNEYKVPTVAEVLGKVKQARADGKQVGAYIETKEPEFHHNYDIDLEDLLMKDLNQSGLLNDPGAIILQSFSMASLIKLNSLLQDAEFTSIPLTWLISCASEEPSDEELENFAKFGTSLGVDKKLLAEIKYDAPECHRERAKLCYEVTQNQTCVGRIKHSLNHLPIVHPIVEKARSLNLTIHAYTFRNEERFMALNFMADPLMEIKFYMENNISIDGAFVDCPETFLTPNPILEIPETTTVAATETGAETTTVAATETGAETTTVATTEAGAETTTVAATETEMTPTTTKTAKTETTTTAEILSTDSGGATNLNENDEGDDEGDDDEDDDGSSSHGSTVAVVISIILLIVAVAVIGLWVLYKRNSSLFKRGRFVELSNDVERADYSL